MESCGAKVTHQRRYRSPRNRTTLVSLPHSNHCSNVEEGLKCDLHLIRQQGMVWWKMWGWEAPKKSNLVLIYSYVFSSSLFSTSRYSQVLLYQGWMSSIHFLIQNTILLIQQNMWHLPVNFHTHLEECIITYLRNVLW